MPQDTIKPNAESLKPSASPKRLRVLISAYACEPGKGSEPGCGWNYVLQAARYCSVSVVTRANNQAVIHNYESEFGPTGVNWIFYDLPDWLLRLKKKFGLVNTYYFLWQWFSVEYVRRRLIGSDFNVLHHLTFGSYSKPCFLFRFSNAPLVWGPVGGAVKFKTDFLRHASLRAKLGELSRYVAQKTIRLNLLINVLRRRSSLLLGVSNEILEVLKFPQQGVLSQVGIDEKGFISYPRKTKFSSETYLVLMAGRLLHWKGFSLGLEAFARFLSSYSGTAKLVIIGDGPEKANLEKLASKLGINRNVEFKGTISRDSYFKQLGHADTVLFPSSHEPGSYVVAEALAFGVPVICSAFGEPITLVQHGVSGYAVSLGEYTLAIENISNFLNRLADPAHCKEMSVAAVNRSLMLSWGSRGDTLYGYYRQVVELQE